MRVAVSGTQSAIIVLVVVLLVGLLAFVNGFGGTQDIDGASEAASSPAACSVGNYVSAVTESAAGVVSYTCTADNPAEAASAPAACNTNFFVSAVAESAAGVISYTCTQVSFTGLSNYPANCAAGEYVYGVGATLTCQDVATDAFVSNANSCADTTSGGAGKMAGFGVTYTTGAANQEHDLVVTLNWKLTAPTTVTVNTQWIFKYGSTTTPTCGQATTGTSVGNTYEFLNPVAATTGAQVMQSETVAVLGLTASTTYWFDLSIIDSSTASWTYSLPQLTVTEI